jgi:hypothetical protein
MAPYQALTTLRAESEHANRYALAPASHSDDTFKLHPFICLKFLARPKRRERGA